MEAVLAALVGGALTISGGFVVVIATERREARRWRRDSQLKASTDLLSALQSLVRCVIDVAYLDDKRGVEARMVLSARREAATAWNTAMYAALIVSPSGVADQIRILDREVDKLFEQAIARRWSRDEFREERRMLGRLAAQYMNTARTMAGLSGTQINSVWAWDATTNEQGSPSL